MEEESLLPEVRPDMTDEGLGPWSVSKLKTLQQCPLQFYLRYIVKFRPPEKPLDEDGLLTQWGKASHEVLDYVARGLSVDAAYQRVEVESKKYLPEEHFGPVRENRFSIEQFWQRIQDFKIRHKVKAIHPEMKVGVTKDFEKAGFFDDDVWFRGIIDLALELENGDVVVIDHKRGPNPDWGGTKNYRFQLDTYLPLFHYGIKPVNGGVTGVNFINHGKTILDDYTKLDCIENRIPKEIKFYTETAVESVVEKGGFHHKRGNQCKYCDYSELCKGGKRGTSGELEKFASASEQLINIKEI